MRGGEGRNKLPCRVPVGCLAVVVGGKTRSTRFPANGDLHKPPVDFFFLPEHNAMYLCVCTPWASGLSLYGDVGGGVSVGRKT